MDGRIVGATEKLTRAVYKLNPAYEPVSCNVKRNTVEMEMSNGIMSIKVKYPRDIIEGVLEGQDFDVLMAGWDTPEEPEEEQGDLEEEEETPEEEETEEEKPPTTKPARRIVRNAKNNKKKD